MLAAELRIDRLANRRERRSRSGQLLRQHRLSHANIAARPVIRFEAGEERTVAFEAIKLTRGTHTLQVVIDPNNRVTESDRTNNTFTENKLVCK